MTPMNHSPFPDHVPTPPLDEPFLWYTNDDIEMEPAAMTTTHLFHSLRMVWNHTVDEAYRLQPYKAWAGVGGWPADYRRDAMIAFMAELAKRKDLTDEMGKDLAHMARHAGAFQQALEAAEREELMDEARHPDRDGGGD